MGILHEQVLGNLYFKATACQTTVLKSSVNCLQKPTGSELPWGNIDRQLNVRIGSFPPVSSFLTRLFYHIRANFFNQTIFFCHGDENSRGHQPEIFVLPSYERFCPDNLFGGRVNFGLVEDRKLFVSDGMP